MVKMEIGTISVNLLRHNRPYSVELSVHSLYEGTEHETNVCSSVTFDYLHLVKFRWS